jgi:hypothetical protein
VKRCSLSLSLPLRILVLHYICVFLCVHSALLWPIIEKSHLFEMDKKENQRRFDRLFSKCLLFLKDYIQFQFHKGFFPFFPSIHPSVCCSVILLYFFRNKRTRGIKCISFLFVKDSSFSASIHRSKGDNLELSRGPSDSIFDF